MHLHAILCACIFFRCVSSLLRHVLIINICDDVHVIQTVQLHGQTRTKFLSRNSISRHISATPGTDTHARVYTRACRARWSGMGGRSEHCPPRASLRLLRGYHTRSAFIVQRYVPPAQTGNSGRVRCRATRQIGGDASIDTTGDREHRRR